MSGHRCQQCLRRGDGLGDGLVDREHVKTVVVWSVAGYRSRTRVAAVPQIRANEPYSVCSRLQQARPDAVHRRVDHRDGVQERAGQRHVDVVDDEHHLPGSGRQVVLIPAQMREVLSPTPLPAFDAGIALPSVNATLVTAMYSGAAKALPDNGLRCSLERTRRSILPSAGIRCATSRAAHGDRARAQQVAEFGGQGAPAL
jgi:hypothetical protein